MKLIIPNKKIIINNKYFLKRLYEEAKPLKTIRRASYKELLSVLHALKAITDGQVPVKKSTWNLITQNKKKFEKFIDNFNSKDKFSHLLNLSSQRERETFVLKNIALIKLFLSAYFIYGY